MAAASGPLRVQLDLPPGERQQQFVDQLNAALRSIVGSSSGTAGYDDEGNFRSMLAGSLRLPCGEASLAWTFVWRPNGDLGAIEVDPSGFEQPPAWDQDVNTIITQSLTAALAERQERFFHRAVFNYIGPALDGEYWFDGFRFAPLLPSDEQPALVNAERLVVLDAYVDGIDRTHAAAVGAERARRYAARISLLANLGLYGTPHENRWVMQISKTRRIESFRPQLGYYANDLVLGAMPEKGEVCRLGAFTGNLSERYRAVGEHGHVTLPAETRRVLGRLRDASAATVSAFDHCARLYQVALVCGRIYPSVGSAYRVAAVEAIVQATHEHQGFSDFIRANVRDRDDLDALTDYLYNKVRSAHFHAGEFSSGEFSRPSHFDPVMDPEEAIRQDLHWRGNEIIREAIVSWILRTLSLGS